MVYDLCSTAQLAWRLSNILRGFSPLRVVPHFHLVQVTHWQQLSAHVESAVLAPSGSYIDRFPSHLRVASVDAVVWLSHQECLLLFATQLRRWACCISQDREATRNPGKKHSQPLGASCKILGAPIQAFTPGSQLQGTQSFSEHVNP